MPTTALVWMRRDLRLSDNPALEGARQRCERIIPVYIHSPDEEAPWQPGAASRWWLHHSLEALHHALQERGSRLIIRRGDSLGALRALAREAGATEVHWNRCYEPAATERDSRIKAALRAEGLWCASYNGLLCNEPWTLKTGQDAPYRVFTPYWRQLAPRLAQQPPPTPAPAALPPISDTLERLDVDALALQPTIPWDQGLREQWRPGEAGALERLSRFVSDGLDHYAEARDLPAVEGTSRLSPHLHFGELSPRQVIEQVQAGRPDPELSEPYLRELGWREFSYQLLYHFPQTPAEPLDPRFAAFPWRSEDADSLLAAWQQGRTGIPIVDAGMRELWQTGWMHNRVRMIVASLLTKNLRQPWQQGARWFWDTLVDADLANNTQGWQWSAGCGADAAPYFRIFNPVRQGERFDPQGGYVRRWCPELHRLPDKLIHQPWQASETEREACGVRLGRDYPWPIVDLKASRAEALAAYDQIKRGGSATRARS
ncbi:cryptochrome/photolyase family protein [Halochromatium glycolicum]|uniref:Deoxyribodipyrimidine photo-lyase n=1 Tax=Halochromatium glycolicum TaxID=85075 RepID=A0AAJ0XBH2_9GAMM|nr:deoxyribodipyrimidine photo-lyase [Halochromatium glycolicum]MBK1706130.1 deoxyribodipyrimidine photolyase [Halochromatium glycolicum]